MINVTQSYVPDLKKYLSYLERVFKNGQFTNNGDMVKELSFRLEQYLGVKNLELVANGMLALQLAIRALGLKGDIITTPYSYVATANSIVWEGCRPIFVDIEERTFCVNPELIEAAITENTTAILATHVYGYPCDVDKISEIASRHKLKIIYDAAHCFGVKYNGRSILEYGDVSILSFHATKLFHTAEGGATVSGKDVASKIRLMKKFGHVGEDEYLSIGINAKMSELHAAMGLCVLPEVDELIGIRRTLSEKYDELLLGNGIGRPVKTEGLEYNYAYYPILFPDHNSMMSARAALIEQDIFARRYFYPSLNALSYLADPGRFSCKVSEDVSTRVLSLPLSHELQASEVEKISSIILDNLR